MARGQSVFGIFMIYIILGIVYFVGLAGAVGTLAAGAVVEGGLTGLEGWFFSNINFVITIAYILGMMAIGYFGGR